jgi:hypothetical protein
VKHIKISKVLDLAADMHLLDGVDYEEGQSAFSCVAIEHAINHANGRGCYWDCVSEVVCATARRGSLGWRIRRGLRNLGLDPGSEHAFSEFKEGPERQAVRYAWLKFCAQLAREQGD